MMSCSREDKEACVQTWKWFSGKDTRPEQWNDDAIQALVELVAKVRECSENMDMVPQPSGRPSITWLARQALRPLKTYFMGHGVYDSCKTFGYSAKKSDVEIALMGRDQ